MEAVPRERSPRWLEGGTEGCKQHGRSAACTASKVVNIYLYKDVKAHPVTVPSPQAATTRWNAVCTAAATPAPSRRA